MIAATTRLQRPREISGRKRSRSATFANFSVDPRTIPSPPSLRKRMRTLVQFCGMIS